MPWVSVDDRFPLHPKVVAAGALAQAMQVAGLCYCNRELTDGFIPRSIARTLIDWTFEYDGKVYTIGVGTGSLEEPSTYASDMTCQFGINILLSHGIWEEVPGGYHIHDYEDYQPTREEIEFKREQKRQAGVAGGKASAQARAQARAQASAQADAQADAQAPAQADAQAKSNPQYPIPNTQEKNDSKLVEPSSTDPVPPVVSEDGIRPFDLETAVTESMSRYATAPANRRAAVLAEIYGTVFNVKPEGAVYGRLGRLANRHTVEAVIRALYQHGDKALVGDPIDYLTRVLERRIATPDHPKRIAWHPAGYRTEVPDERLTLSELAIKFRQTDGVPHVSSARRARLGKAFANVLVHEYRAHLAFATLARSSWIETTEGKALKKKYVDALRRAQSANPELEQDWERYLATEVDEAFRDAVNGVVV